MRGNVVAILIGSTLLLWNSALRGQGESAVPFLLITPTIEGNGMGGVGTSVSSDNAMAPMQNPGQLGLFSLRGFLNAGFYTPSTNWLPQFNISGLQYNAWAVNAAVKVHDQVELPFRLGIAAGYSRINLDLGRFAVTGSQGPGVLAYFDAFEKSSNVTVGLGVEYVIRAGVGMTFKSIESNLSPVGTEQEQVGGKARVTARDVGVMAQLPLPELIEALSGESLEFLPKVKPLADIGFGYARSNVGDPVSYLSAALSDPLPRKASVGACVELGAVSTVLGPDWKPLSFIIVRDAEDLLVKREPDGTWEYQSGLGDISLIDNVILGKVPENATLRRGWQFQVGEALYIRGGSVASPGLTYETSGYSLRLGGVLKMIMVISPVMREEGWFRFLADVLDLQYTSAKYTGTASPIGETSFQGINIVLRSIPFL